MVEFVEPRKVFAVSEHAFERLFQRLNVLNAFKVREAVYWWQIEYNEQCPHDALDGIPPVAYRIKNAENSTYELSA